jgi:hypothetical protein
MRKVKLFIASSLDGYIAREDRGHRLWLSTDADADYGYSQFYDSIDTILISRKNIRSIP